jgi:predicted transglutaminase-like cysteine proteinase
MQYAVPQTGLLIRRAGVALLLAVWLALPLVLADSVGLKPELLAWVDQKYGPQARERVLEWQSFMARHQDKDERAKLELVNDFFNEIPYGSDYDIWGQEDYWATPVEMLSIGGADCEDFSIAKYFTLREMGVPVEKMRIMYVRAKGWNVPHMVLTYYPTANAEPLVLDNLNTLIKPASKRMDLTPVYSFNGEGLWLAKERGRGQRVGSSGRISLWQDLTAKMAKEGG